MRHVRSPIDLLSAASWIEGLPGACGELIGGSCDERLYLLGRGRRIAVQLELTGPGSSIELELHGGGSTVTEAASSLRRRNLESLVRRARMWLELR